ncbi:F-box DNA helicase 1 [Spea bombifrons]|uniref:F-box DNA helicase 1 n=1 Tax=Spea bombifrons TaxID=233779 RepID=UPI00234A3EE6|nr:F-box DNA helicase 1 [Spea bombifrons]
MRRLRHLTETDCQQLGQSREGSYSLTQPLSQRRTSRDVNYGLYPWNRTERFSRGRSSTGFQKNGMNKDRDSSSSKPIPINVEEMDCTASEDELFLNYSDEVSEQFDGANMSQTEAASNRKRHCYSAESGSPDKKYWLSGGDCKTIPSNNVEEEEDDLVPDPCYGLLGVNDPVPCEKINQFPDELLQCIFGFLPMVELYKNVSLVCQKWKTLVSDALFIPWKKCYHRYIGKDSQAVNDIGNLLKTNGITAENDQCILNLVKYFSTHISSRDANHEAILGCLRKHHLYAVAEACVIHRLPEMGNIIESVNAWAVIAVILLLSHEVTDIQKLMKCLEKPSSMLRHVEITEALYCLATLLFAMREHKILISNRIHYNIFYCLYLLENNRSHGTAPNNLAKPKFCLTSEQQHIVNHDIAPGQVVKIMAFAGTGKTSTLIKYAEKRPSLRFLYLSFNKSITQHASQRFPRNVTCKTFHALAYAKFGYKYRQKQKLNPFKLTAYAINCVLPEGQGGFIRAKLVAKTLETFFSSAEESIEREHVPIWYINTNGAKSLVTPELQSFAVSQAETIWEKMKRLETTRQSAYKMTHDGYLKLWQLSGPDLSYYDAIFVDEAQDCTPSIMQVVTSQTCGKIFVGDPHQQIYSFRGAVNALCEVPHTHIYYLTQSFRFGAEIAYVGATILDACKKLRHKTLVGENQKGTILGTSSREFAILSRTNSSIFDEAVRLTEGEFPSTIHIIGGPEKFGLNKIYDIWKLLQPVQERLRQNLQIEDASIKMWAKIGGFSALKKYAISSEDRELESKIAIVEKYNVRIPELVKRIRSCHTDSSADYILGTVHKAKGLEFDTVLITDDFLKIPSARHNLEGQQIPLGLSLEDEWNLLYVAVTRAKTHLIITKNVENILTLAGEYLFRAEPTSQALKEGPISCALKQCNNTIPENSVLTMKKLPIVYSDKTEDKGGYICHSCVLQRVGPITQLLASPNLVTSMEINQENVMMPRHVEQLLQAI